MKSPLFAVLIALAIIPFSCAKRPDPQVLATVGPNQILAEQFQEQMLRRGGARPQSMDRNALLQEMIDHEALYLRALNAGLDKDPELQRTWKNLLIARLKEHELTPRIAMAEISQAELQAAYTVDRNRYTRPAAIRLAVLYLKTDPLTKPDKIAELQNRMLDARQQALAGENAAAGFGALAIQFSEDQATRYNGGLLGWVEQNRGHAWLSPGVIEAGFSLKNPGDLSEVLTDPKGIFLIKLVERRESTLIPLSEVEPALRQRLLLEKRRQIEQAFAAETRQSVPVRAHPEFLERISLPASKSVADSTQPPVFP